MKRLSSFALAVATVCALSQSASAGVLIDDFEKGFIDIEDTVRDGTAASAVGVSIVGGSDVFSTRDLTVEEVGGTGVDDPTGVSGVVSAGTSGLDIYSEDGGNFGRFELAYADAGGADLVGTGATMFSFDADSEIGIDLVFEITSSTGTYSATTSILGDIDGVLEHYTLTFSSFTGALLSDFQNVLSFRIYHDGTTESQDLRLDNLSTVTPEPGTMALLALGGIGLAGARLRRRKAA